MIAEPKDKILSDIKKKLLLNEKLVIGNLIANANEQVHHHKDFLIDFNKNYKRPIQIMQHLPKSLDKLVKHKIITAPLHSKSIWNIPPECEKSLIDSHRKRSQFFRGRISRFGSSYRGNRFSRGLSRGSKSLTKKASSSKFTSKHDPQ